MKIQVVVCLMTMVLAFGDALKCYSCSWSKDGKYPDNDERCVNPESLPDEFIMDCQDGWEESCLFLELRNDENMKIKVERGCSNLSGVGHECILSHSGSTSGCTCDRDGCNNFIGN